MTHMHLSFAPRHALSVTTSGAFSFTNEEAFGVADTDSENHRSSPPRPTPRLSAGGGGPGPSAGAGAGAGASSGTGPDDARQSLASQETGGADSPAAAAAAVATSGAVTVSQLLLIQAWESELRKLGERARGVQTSRADSKVLTQEYEEARETKTIRVQQHTRAVLADQDWDALPDGHPDKTLDNLARISHRIRDAAKSSQRAMAHFAQSAKRRARGVQQAQHEAEQFQAALDTFKRAVLSSS